MLLKARNIQTFKDEVWLSMIMDVESFAGICAFQTLRWKWFLMKSHRHATHHFQAQVTNAASFPSTSSCTNTNTYFMDMANFSLFIHTRNCCRQPHISQFSVQNTLKNSKLICKWIVLSNVRVCLASAAKFLFISKFISSLRVYFMVAFDAPNHWVNRALSSSSN